MQENTTQENQPTQQLNNREQYEQKRQQKLAEQARIVQKKTIKRISKIALAVLLVGGSLGLLVWYVMSRPTTPENEIISRTGLHWHPELAIFVKGERQGIPADIGIGVVHNPLHTHDASGVIHMEMSGLVKKSDTTLGDFFAVWNKHLEDFGTTTPRMTMNDAENTELLDYPMKDKDKIELYFE